MAGKKNKTQAPRPSYKKKNKDKTQEVRLVSAGKTEAPVAAEIQTGEAVSVQTIQQLRAKYALKKVLAMAEAGGTEAERFKAYSNSLPAMIQMNGLGQAMAFAKQKSATKGPEAIAWQALYQLVSKWLTETEDKGNPVYKGYPDVLAGITEGSMQKYQLAQAETQALLVWVKQFARAEIVSKETGGH